MATERSSGGAGQARSRPSRGPTARPEQETPPPMETMETSMPATDVEQRRPATTQMARPGLFDQAREGTFRQLNRQKERAATGLTSVVDALRQSGRQLEGQNATVASYVDAAAGQVERFVGGLRDRDVGAMVTDLEQFARRRPAMFLGSAFLLGLVTARFLKSSTKPEEPWRQSMAGSERPITRGAEYASPGSENPLWTESQRTSTMPPTPTTPRESEPLA